MAYATIFFVNSRTGAMRDAPVGFSWTTLFFGFIPAMIRGHWTIALVQIICAMLTWGLSNIVFAFIRNRNRNYHPNYAEHNW